MADLPWVRTSLVPEGRNGSDGRSYQLNADSVSPTRIIEIGEDGLPVEETICALAKHERFVDPSGNVCDVALRTGRVPSEEPEAQRYEQVVIADLIRQNQLPLRCCPYTLEYRHIKGGPLIKPPKGAEDCGGHPDGCAHMKAEIEKRRRVARAKYDKQEQQAKTMSKDDVKQMLEGIAETFGDLKNELRGGISSGRKNLQTDKSEPG